MNPKVFKLITGEEIIADVVKVETVSAAGRTQVKVFEVRWPMLVSLNHGQLDIVPWIIGERDPGQLYPIRFEHILFYLEHIDDLLEEIYEGFLQTRLDEAAMGVRIREDQNITES